MGSHAFLAGALALSLMGCNRQQGSPRRGGVADTDPVDLYRGWGSVWAEQLSAEISRAALSAEKGARVLGGP